MIDYNKILAMIAHWLESEINGYIGSDYGPDFNSLFLAPLSAPEKRYSNPKTVKR